MIGVVFVYYDCCRAERGSLTEILLPLRYIKLKKDYGDSCAVCLQEMTQGTFAALIKRCGHCFHKGCIEVWIDRKGECPVCRINL